MNIYFRKVTEFLWIAVLLAILINTSYAQNADAALVAYYRLDGDLKDEIGLSDGSFAAGNLKPNKLDHFIDGHDGMQKGALLFGGNGNTWFRVDLGNYSPVQLGTDGEMTVAFWAYWNGSTGSWQDIINKRDTWSSNGMVWGINQHAATGHKLSLRQPNSNADSDVGIPVGEWTHVAVAADGQNAYFFVNGHLEDTKPYTYGTKYTSEIHMGTSPNGAVDAFNGALDDVRFYSRVLTEAEVREIMTPGTPLSIFSYSPDTVLVTDTVRFDASGSYDTNGEIVSYAWDFGDSESDSGVTTSHAYISPGDYTVTLVVVDNEDNSSVSKQTITVYSGEPFAEFTFLPHFPTAGQSVHFDGSSSWDVNGTIEHYQWDFGDGTTDTSISKIHSFADAGEYSVTLTVTDNDAKINSKTKSVTVYPGESPIRILPLGNSITQSNNTHYSYRYNLWKKLIDGGHHFDFVGSLNSNFGGNPDWPLYQGKNFDQDHEGHWGWRADQILQNLPEWQNNYTADIALLHIGSQDCAQNNSIESTVGEIKQIIDTLRNSNPKVMILLAKLIPWNDPAINNMINDLNSQMDHIAAEKTTSASPVIIVDQNTGFDNVNDTFDGIHPNESGEEKMAANWYAAIDSLLKHRTSGKPRIIATTDGEYDDQCSMIRFLLYTNEWDVEGMIHSSSKFHWVGHNWAGTDWIKKDIDLYGQVYNNLIQHDTEYPTPDYLLSKVFIGNIDNVGEMSKETPGSNRIVDVLLDSDPGPVWLQAWGGTNTIARALKTIQEQYPDKMNEVSQKATLYIILDQDNTYTNYIKPNWPDLPVLYSQSQFAAIAYSWSDIIPQPYHAYFEEDWMKENITENHGPLCSNYPSKNFGSEGDTPSFLHNIPVGLRQMENPAYGGWGGRFELKDQSSQWWGAKDDNDLFKSIYRWSKGFQNDFAARADWCVNDYNSANHRPEISVLGELDQEVAAGSKVILNASGTTDPDGNEMTFKWWQYRDAGNAKTNIIINNSTSGDSASFIVPNEPGKEIHIILTVTDNGTPNLDAYTRLIFKIAGETSVESQSSSMPPEKYKLYNSYPNPFNPSATIEFQIPQDGHVTISVFNTVGQRVATLIDKDLKSGTHQATFDAIHFSSGIYFYSMKTNDFSQVNKMLLLK